jgi:uncharacterized protein (TIGR03435 family)
MSLVPVLILRPLVIGVLTLSAVGQVPIPASGSSDSSATSPRFQVATIKPSSPDERRLLQIQGNRFATTATSVVDLLKYAYGLHEQEIDGGPKWLKTQTFDLVGDPESQTRPSSDQFKKMVRVLLADRFHLTAHYETRDLPVFVIVPAKGGPKLSRSTMPPDGLPRYGYSPGKFAVRNATMGDFAGYLQRFVADRAVFDGTGISGKYDLDLRWAPDEMQTEVSRPGNDDLPGLYTAIQEQLGLKLQEEKRPAQVFVIDHVDLPSQD